MKFYAFMMLLLLSISTLPAEVNKDMTDEELFHICYKNAGKRIVDELIDAGYTEICVIENPEDKDDNSDIVIIESITNEMKNQNGSVYLKESYSETDELLLFYRIISKNIYFEEKEHFFGEPILLRDVRITLSYRLVDQKTGEILIASEIDESIENEISKKVYTNLKKGIKRKGISISHFIEPTLIIAIVGGLMYIFYSQKSSQ
ncbi:hypothetical protein KAX75_08350 [candidate division WOR-3 bacterium]|nr:hypothetical protein [candidate division WOR-3 bacterium]